MKILMKRSQINKANKNNLRFYEEFIVVPKPYKILTKVNQVLKNCCSLSYCILLSELISGARMLVHIFAILFPGPLIKLTCHYPFKVFKMSPKNLFGQQMRRAQNLWQRSKDLGRGTIFKTEWIFSSFDLDYIDPKQADLLRYGLIGQTLRRKADNLFRL